MDRVLSLNLSIMNVFFQGGRPTFTSINYVHLLKRKVLKQHIKLNIWILHYVSYNSILSVEVICARVNKYIMWDVTMETCVYGTWHRSNAKAMTCNNGI